MFSRIRHTGPSLAMLALTASSAYAQLAIPTNGGDPLRILSTKGSGAYINCQTGNCSFDVPTQLNLSILKALGDAQSVTRKRYEEIMDHTREDMSKFYRSLYEDGKDPGLVALSLRSMGQAHMEDAQVLYGAYARYIQSFNLVKQDFDMRALFFKGELPGIALETKNYLANNLPTYAPANINAVNEIFWNNLKVINKTVCALTFNLKLATGEPALNSKPLVCDQYNDNVAISLNYQGVTLSKEEIDDLEANRTRLKNPTSGTIAAVSNLGRNTHAAIQAFVKAWGEDQANRLTDQQSSSGWYAKLTGKRVQQGNQVRADVLQSTFDGIVRAFWERSFIRKIYGLPVGGFYINYEPQKYQKDLFLTDYHTLLDFSPDPMFLTQDWTSKAIFAQRNYAEAVNTAESKAQDAFGNLLRGDMGVLDRANSFWETIKGRSPTWQVLSMCLKLMAADFVEEVTVRQVGGLAKLEGIYRARYVDIPSTEKTRYDGYKHAFNVMIGVEQSNSNYDDTGALMGGTDDASLIQGLDRQYQDWMTNIGQARAISVQIDVARQKGKSPEFQKMMRRAQD